IGFNPWLSTTFLTQLRKTGIIRHENHFVNTFFEKNIKKYKKRENPKITRKTVPEPAWTREAGSDIIGEYKR
ncbi:hypothetical protein RFY99_07820, partial [Acinetobacter baumannii]|nr:hypothetical protein [Acinetobacter baumannii]